MYNTFELNIRYKYHIKGYSNLIFWNKLLINTKTGRIKKQSYNGGMIGYWLTSKMFKSAKWCESNLVLVKKEKLLF